MPHLPEGGVIINTTSVTAYRGSANLVDYAATKGAIVAFTRSSAMQLVEKKIRVNTVPAGTHLDAAHSLHLRGQQGFQVRLGRSARSRGRASQSAPPTFFSPRKTRRISLARCCTLTAARSSTADARSTAVIKSHWSPLEQPLARCTRITAPSAAKSRGSGRTVVWHNTCYLPSGLACRSGGDRAVLVSGQGVCHVPNCRPAVSSRIDWLPAD